MCNSVADSQNLVQCDECSVAFHIYCANHQITVKCVSTVLCDACDAKPQVCMDSTVDAVESMHTCGSASKASHNTVDTHLSVICWFAQYM